jgi:flagellar basal body-associated protein FliL
VYLYDHSGLTMNTKGFNCPWDSGQVGWIYASHEQVKAEYGAVTPENLKKAESILESEVKLYDYYLTNQCYGFQLFEGDVETDSCWGFYGEIRDVQDAVKEYLPDECQDIVEVLQYRNVKMKSKNPDQDKKAKKKVLLVLLLLLIFCMSGIGIYVVYTSNSKENIPTDASSTGESKKLDDNGNAVDGAVQSKTSEQVLDELKKAQINVTDKLSSHILFPSGKAGTEGSWMVENVETNNVIMQCEVFLNDKLIAKSVPIKPNQHIETITLSKEVKAGMYDVTAYINYFKLDTKEYISKAGFRVKLTVQ